MITYTDISVHRLIAAAYNTLQKAIDENMENSQVFAELSEALDKLEVSGSRGEP